MKTPIVDFVRSYRRAKYVRAHMPGHKGKGFLGIEKNDITEFSGADVLYSAEGIIKKSMQNAAELFGTAATFYSTEGSTLAIKAMLAAALENADNSRILAARNVHKAFIYAAAQLLAEVDWLYGKSSNICECIVTPAEVEESLKKGNYACVYITSPDYLGNIADIKGIAEVCRKYGTLLLVDNAHGAYLKFLESSLHPIDLGAAMCADSAHKTLPVLTGGAYLQVGKGYRNLAESVAKKLPVFASTSPSYLILQSLDFCNKYLKKSAVNYKNCAKKVEKLKAKLVKNGYALKCSEPLKITVSAAEMGYTGFELSRLFESKKIMCVFCVSEFFVLMLSPQNTARDFRKIASVKVEKRPPLERKKLSIAENERAMSLNAAVFSKSETVLSSNSVGRVCAAPTAACPPAVPIVVSGEIISEQAAKLLKEYSVENIEVVAGAN